MRQLQALAFEPPRVPSQGPYGGSTLKPTRGSLEGTGLETVHQVYWSAVGEGPGYAFPPGAAWSPRGSLQSWVLRSLFSGLFFPNSSPPPTHFLTF